MSENLLSLPNKFEEHPEQFSTKCNISLSDGFHFEMRIPFRSWTKWPNLLRRNSYLSPFDWVTLSNLRCHSCFLLPINICYRLYILYIKVRTNRPKYNPRTSEPNIQKPSLNEIILKQLQQKLNFFEKLKLIIIQCFEIVFVANHRLLCIS